MPEAVFGGCGGVTDIKVERVGEVRADAAETIGLNVTVRGGRRGGCCGMRGEVSVALDAMTFG